MTPFTIRSITCIRTGHGVVSMAVKDQWVGLA